MGMSLKLKTHLRSKYGAWAVITGASSGIGKELAERLGEAGLNLILVARRQEKLEALSRQLENQYGVQTRVLLADLATEAGVESVLKYTEGMEVGLLVAAAGFGTSGAFLGGELEAEKSMLAVNCQALLGLTHHFAHEFARRGRGGIILMSSMVSFQGVPFAAHYAATKAYVQSLAEALAIELRPQGVDVLSAAPGPVQSGFADRANMKMGKVLRPEDVGIPILKALGKRNTVLPGFLTKFLVGLLRTLPRAGKIRVMRMVMGGMTKHQRA